MVIEVADQGCGVPESLRDKIFEQGVSTRADEPGEHGIGLYLIASYVTRCGGVITLEDNDPCGTLFSIYIPKVKPNDSSINPIDRLRTKRRWQRCMRNISSHSRIQSDITGGKTWRRPE